MSDGCQVSPGSPSCLFECLCMCAIGCHNDGGDGRIEFQDTVWFDDALPGELTPGQLETLLQTDLRTPEQLGEP
ncbi:Hypothetical predicted protein [Xyrichtys novacula]|uniref:Uncharacterized protein n=1 Tax=Xyrichtys novacula TaxID=13765 RepID=A0AAV1F0N9_XYRNO|nr:Hypothetical predicted protein [Xyrichtys novacula]